MSEEEDPILEYIWKLEHSHEALLTTLSASKSKWIQWVVRNARARWDSIVDEYANKE